MLSQDQLAVALKAFLDALPPGTTVRTLQVTPKVGYADTEAKPVLALVLADDDGDFRRFTQVIDRGIEAYRTEHGLTAAFLREDFGAPQGKG